VRQVLLQCRHHSNLMFLPSPRLRGLSALLLLVDCFFITFAILGIPSLAAPQERCNATATVADLHSHCRLLHSHSCSNATATIVMLLPSRHHQVDVCCRGVMFLPPWCWGYRLVLLSLFLSPSLGLSLGVAVAFLVSVTVTLLLAPSPSPSIAITIHRCCH